MRARLTSGLLAAVIGTATLGSGPAEAQLTDLVSQSAFRVCADPANLPMSSESGEGFENEIAEHFAEVLDRELQYTWFPMALGFLRNTLLNYRCDVIIGYAQGDEMVLNTNHYYTSAYVIVTRSDSDIADVDTIADPRLTDKRIGVVAGTPPASHAARHGLMKKAKGYDLMVDRRVESPNEDMIADLLEGEIDAALMWGPIAGPLVKAEGDALTMTPLLKEQGSPRLFYRITMGVRQGEDNWKRELNSLIRQEQEEIDAILTRYGVPLVDDMGTSLKAELPPVIALLAVVIALAAGSAIAETDPEPAGFRGEPYRAPVPASLAGASVIGTEEAARLWRSGEAAFIDVLPQAPRPELPEGTVWRDPPHPTIPGALWLPNTGYQALSPAEEEYLAAGLAAASKGRHDRPLVIFCFSDCWMSWNAAKRAVALGYTDVRWFPDGIDAWQFEALPIETVKPFEP